MSKFWHILASVGLGVLTIVTPATQTFIGAHPAVSAVLAAIWAILGNVLPSPVAVTKSP